MYRKNTASQYVYFCLVNATTGAALTGATVTAYRALDNGAQATATGTTTELANGQYRFNLSQADTNGDYGSYLFTATNAVPVEKTVVFTQANPQDAAGFGLSRLDATVTSRMGAYTQPVGFLAATFPTTVASPTNITSASGVTLAATTHTGAVIPTVTSVTNPVTAGTVSDKTGYSLANLTVSAGTTLASGTHQPQTGDSFARIGANGAGLTSIGDTRLANLDAAVSSRMATFSLPANFAALGINASGHVSRVVLVDTTTTNSDMITAAGIRSAVGLASANLDSQLADIPTVSEFNARTLPSASYFDPATDAVNVDRWSGQSVSLDSDNLPVVSVENYYDTSLLSWLPISGRFSTILSAIDAVDNFVDTEVGAIKAVMDKVDTMLVLDGAVWQLTVNALENAPAGGGGGGSGDASQATLLQVKAKTDLIVAGEVQYTSPVQPSGQITSPIFIGDDYKASIGRAFQWTISARSGYSVGTATCRFGGSSDTTATSWNVTGTVSDLGGGQWRLSFDLPKATTGALQAGFYKWSVELINAGGDEVTEVFHSTANRMVEVRSKQT